MNGVDSVENLSFLPENIQKHRKKRWPRNIKQINFNNDYKLISKKE
jgi:hypothetical protein